MNLANPRRPLTGILPGRLHSLHQLMPYRHYQVRGWHPSMGCPSDEDSSLCAGKRCTRKMNQIWYGSSWLTSLKFYITRWLLSQSCPSVCNSFASSWLGMAQSSGAYKSLYLSTCLITSPASSSVSFNVSLVPRSGILRYQVTVSTTRLIFLRPVSSTWCQTFWCCYSHSCALGIYICLSNGSWKYQQCSWLGGCKYRIPVTKPEAAMRLVLMLNKYTRALAASILRFIYSTINRGSHDATFDLTRVGVSTCVVPTQKFKP